MALARSALSLAETPMKRAKVRPTATLSSAEEVQTQPTRTTPPSTAEFPTRQVQLVQPSVAEWGTRLAEQARPLPVVVVSVPHAVFGRMIFASATPPAEIILQSEVATTTRQPVCSRQ